MSIKIILFVGLLVGWMTKEYASSCFRAELVCMWFPIKSIAQATNTLFMDFLFYFIFWISNNSHDGIVKWFMKQTLIRCFSLKYN